MIIECITIVLIIAMMSFIFLRTKRRTYALVTLPLLTVPLLHLLGQGFAYSALRTADPSIRVIAILSADLLGLLIGALFLGMLSGNLKNKKVRISFLVIAAVFMIALSIVLMTSLIGLQV